MFLTKGAALQCPRLGREAFWGLCGALSVQCPAARGSNPRQDRGTGLVGDTTLLCRVFPSEPMAELSSGHQGLELSVWEALVLPWRIPSTNWIQIRASPDTPGSHASLSMFLLVSWLSLPREAG